MPDLPIPDKAMHTAQTPPPSVSWQEEKPHPDYLRKTPRLPHPGKQEAIPFLNECRTYWSMFSETSHPQTYNLIKRMQDRLLSYIQHSKEWIPIAGIHCYR